MTVAHETQLACLAELATLVNPRDDAAAAAAFRAMMPFDEIPPSVWTSAGMRATARKLVGMPNYGKLCEALEATSHSIKGNSSHAAMDLPDSPINWDFELADLIHLKWWRARQAENYANAPPFIAERIGGPEAYYLSLLRAFSFKVWCFISGRPVNPKFQERTEEQKAAVSRICAEARAAMRGAAQSSKSALSGGYQASAMPSGATTKSGDVVSNVAPEHLAELRRAAGIGPSRSEEYA